MNERRNGQFVLPGQKLGVIEEFIPDLGTFVDDGIIYASNTGLVLMDLSNKTVSVYSKVLNFNFPEVGNVVIGIVKAVQSSQAIIRINMLGKKALSGFFTGAIHVSDVSFKYTDNMSNIFKVGDIVRAKVISRTNKTFHLSTKGNNLGVISSYCSLCGEILSIDRKRLLCKKCGSIENRKISVDYGKDV
jgi:exosome complex component CSL4